MTAVLEPEAAVPVARGGTLEAVDHGRRARFDAGVRLGAGAGLWLSLLLVTYWWVADRGMQDLGGWATGLTSVGRLTGLVASVLLLAQVILMARRARCWSGPSARTGWRDLTGSSASPRST